MKKLVIATGNPGKLKELQELLNGLQIEVISQKSLGISDAEETGLTFVENALIKARHAAAISGLPALADDSGLCVDVLGGAPGIYSATLGEGCSAARLRWYQKTPPEVAAASTAPIAVYPSRCASRRRTSPGEDDRRITAGVRKVTYSQ